MLIGNPGGAGGCCYSEGSLQEALGPIRPSDVFKIVFALRMSSFFWSDQTFDLRTGGGGGARRPLRIGLKKT
jgi:hypothetical protein